MRILMMSNTFTPFVGGLEQSIENFTDVFRKQGHDVLIITPEFEGMPKNEFGVLRLPAWKNFSGTDFSVELPLPSNLGKRLRKFNPEIIHTHHPFLVGDTALRFSEELHIPLVFTHHTLYEEYTHYLPGNLEIYKQFVKELATGYANYCDHVIAPSHSVKEIILKRGVKTPVTVVPTGISNSFRKAKGGHIFRKYFDIPDDAYVLGIVSRISPEKNIDFLTKAVINYLKTDAKAMFLVVGTGKSLAPIQEAFRKNELSQRLLCTGILKGNQLIKAYDAMDVFVFSSHSETQGLVLAEAMLTGTPVVAVDAPGVRDIVVDQKNGRMIDQDSVEKFSQALEWMRNLSPEDRKEVIRQARKTGRKYSNERCARRVMKIYESAIKTHTEEDESRLKRKFNWLNANQKIYSNLLNAFGQSLLDIPKKLFDLPKTSLTMNKDVG